VTPERLRKIGLAAAPWILFGLALWLLFGQALREHMRLASDPSVFNDDVRQQIYPFFRYEDRALFHDDYVGDYYLACLPIGYWFLYFLGAKLIGAAALSKVVPYLLYALTAFALAACAHRIGGKLAAWFAAALCLGTGLYLDRMTGGLPRGFGFPIVAGGALGLVLGKPRWLSLLVWAGAAFYPASAPVVGISLALMLLVLPARDRGEASEWSPRQRWVWLCATAAIAVLVLIPPMWAGRTYGSVITPSRVAEFPEAGPGGRYTPGDDCAPFKGFFQSAEEILTMPFVGAGQALVPNVKGWVDADRTHDRFHHVLYALLVLAAAGWVRLSFLRPEARRLPLLLVAACGGHFVARTFPPFFYLPQRYLMYPLPALATVMVTTGALGFIPKGLSDRKLLWLTPLVVALFGVPLLALFSGHGSNKVGLTTKVNKTGPFAFVAALPPDAMIAGWPGGFMDSVPYVARRRALVTAETYQAFHDRYTLEMRRRTNAVIDAYFATDVAPLLRLKNELKVTHFVADLGVVQKRHARFFRPFDQRISAAIRRTSGTELELERRLGSAVYRDKWRVILDLSRLTSAENTVAQP
jgi:hypothetical protein